MSIYCKLVIIAVVILVVIFILLGVNCGGVGRVVSEQMTGGTYNNCYLKTGFFDSGKCKCKHPSFLGNNIHNGNCDKIVDQQCTKIVDEITGNDIDFNVIDPFKHGRCVCKENYIYDKFTHLCVLRRMGESKIVANTEICNDGYYFSKHYNTCLKSLCSWDVLEPSRRIDQFSIDENKCRCDFMQGYVAITLPNNIVACTQATDRADTYNNDHHICSINERNELIHFYPHSVIKPIFKDNDPHSQWVGIRQSHGNWLNELGGVKFYTDYGIKNDKRTFGDFIINSDLNTPKSTTAFNPVPIAKLLRDDASPSLIEQYGDQTYSTMKYFLSPIVVDEQGKFAINPLAVRDNIFHHVVCYFNKQTNAIIVRNIPRL